MELYNNNPRSTLNGSITNVATSLVVSDATPFPATGTFRILIDSEILKVTVVSSNTFTVTRGTESTTNVSHADKALVLGIFPTAASLSAYRADNVTEDVVANRPSAGTSGRLYFPTDGNGPFGYDNGSAWKSINFYQSSLTTPVASNFSTITHQGSSTFANNGDCAVAHAPAANGTSAYLKAAPTEPWTITAQFNGIFNPIDTSTTLISGYGLVIRQSTASSSATGYETFGFTTGASNIATNGTVFGSQRLLNNSTLGFSVNLFQFGSSTGFTLWYERPIWFRIFQPTVGNRVFSMSIDGQNFTTIFLQGRTNVITPDQVGFFIASDATNNKDVYMLVRSYKET